MVLLVLLTLVYIAQTVEINTLPGYTVGPNNPKLSMDSGYINVDSTNNRNIFYWLIRAEENHQDKPLVVWYQGGPGCSGLIGLLSETGPLRVKEDGKTLEYTNQGWTRFANMLFIEQPAFVGFSFSTTSSDKYTGDQKAAKDNYAFLRGFMKVFPEFQGRDLWFTGESYGGVYVPTVSYLVLSGTDVALKNQFQGFMIGNPVFSCKPNLDFEIMNLLYWHGLASYTNFANWTKSGCNTPDGSVPFFCNSILQRALSEVGVIDQELKRNVEDKNFPSVDPDDLYQDFCTGNGTLDFALSLPKGDWQKTCFDYGERVVNYLNLPETQKAIHAVPTTWSVCTDKIDYKTSGENMLDFYSQFWNLKPSLNVLVYSGDIDILTVPFAFTTPCMLNLSQMIGTRNNLVWQPWFVNGATAGYVESFEKFTYATVKGAGHETPQYQPTTSFELARRFIKDQSLLTEEDKPTTRPTHQVTQSDVLRLVRQISTTN